MPLTYRARVLAGAGDGLTGAAEHGVLGRRWIYDGTCDPVLLAQMVALIQGAAQPQARSVSSTSDPAVTARPVTSGPLTMIGSAVAASGPSGTDLRIGTADADGVRSGQLIVRVSRVLRPGGAVADEAGRPCLSATWRLPDGTRAGAILATALHPGARGAAVESSSRLSLTGSRPGEQSWPGPHRDP